jgi:hypothetical protein
LLYFLAKAGSAVAAALWADGPVAKKLAATEEEKNKFLEDTRRAVRRLWDWDSWSHCSLQWRWKISVCIYFEGDMATIKMRALKKQVTVESISKWCMLGNWITVISI